MLKLHDDANQSIKYDLPERLLMEKMLSQLNAEEVINLSTYNRAKKEMISYGKQTV